MDRDAEFYDPLGMTGAEVGDSFLTNEKPSEDHRKAIEELTACGFVFHIGETEEKSHKTYNGNKVRLWIKELPTHPFYRKVYKLTAAE